MASDKDSVYYNPAADEARKLQAKIKHHELSATKALLIVSEGYIKTLNDYTDMLENSNLYTSKDKETIALATEATRIGRRLVEYNHAFLLALDQLIDENAPDKAGEK